MIKRALTTIVIFTAFCSGGAAGDYPSDYAVHSVIQHYYDEGEEVDVFYTPVINATNLSIVGDFHILFVGIDRFKYDVTPQQLFSTTLSRAPPYI